MTKSRFTLQKNFGRTSGYAEAKWVGNGVNWVMVITENGMLWTAQSTTSSISRMVVLKVCWESLCFEDFYRIYL